MRKVVALAAGAGLLIIGLTAFFAEPKIGTDAPLAAEVSTNSSRRTITETDRSVNSPIGGTSSVESSSWKEVVRRLNDSESNLSLPAPDEVATRFADFSKRARSGDSSAALAIYQLAQTCRAQRTAGGGIRIAKCLVKKSGHQNFG